MFKETLDAAEQIRRRVVFKVFIGTDVSFRLALKIQTFTTRSCNIKDYIFIQNCILQKAILAIRKSEQSLRNLH